MVDHLPSHVTPWRQYTSHVKVRGTLSKMDVNEFCDIFSFTNLIKQTTCLTPTAKHPSLLTNRPRSFKNSVAIGTGLSDHYKMVVTVLTLFRLGGTLCLPSVSSIFVI